MLKEIPSCKRFTGYKPCYPDHNCWIDGCKDNIAIGIKILIINFDAMGDVLMTTAQLPALKRKYPKSAIHWITLSISAPLLKNNLLVDQVFIYNAESLSIISQIEYDLVLNVDKSQRSCALLNSVNAKRKLGFGMDKNGKIIPMNKGAYYNYNLGMDDNLKFKVNKRTRQDYLAETFEIDYKRDDYIFNFTDEELNFINLYKKENGIGENDFVVGFNTGCSLLYPNKKITIKQHIYLIEKLLTFNKGVKIVLLGGPEDAERNDQIYSKFKNKIINTPTNLGVRRGACFENLADIVVTGDSFGMHLAIALKKYVIAWFGVSCWTEIDLYDRGVKLYQEDLFCSPCWKKSCPYDLECIKMIDLDRIVEAIVIYKHKQLMAPHSDRHR
ncbi:MAG: heptosyltransferase [Ignavibacteria bacterium RIFOXYB2_FULL_35_12]|nr:MAG: heptosyltransferase [Ignavibacteria bacterium GWA2_36_19]OGU55593.1 MAG: heptosyltransferase [Ignavibacteria bacterium GWC2_35_8]OGU56132.1 MAG: heptosyltransferase [Ignavibacteria bacterium GWF2_35_20]OGU78222.1 MAG: heptosyltransferase [Ignavibacteria bacterium RIFOXYA2_FULL_35_9]OGU92004.1 MAG: heptosyltransferase [Ignavibacteria bacterium RIFOXYC12_FULL_35_11]OGU97958.1 MAG: heptosyltransferase [Ignavibacteria bacterium RIFOXYB12_FULL_35_14]OGV00772.1 MAG: heptosyltransferase [Ign